MCNVFDFAVEMMMKVTNYNIGTFINLKLQFSK